MRRWRAWCEEGEDAAVVPKPSVSVCVCVSCERDTRGSKVGGHDPGDPVGEEIINQLGGWTEQQEADTHTHT